MILTCPNCGTQYAVKDGAIPPLGRQVRCAACKHSWHQDPEDGAAPAEEPEAAAEPDVVAAIPAEEAPIVEASEEHGDEDESLAEATLIEPRSGPEAEERAYEEAMVDEAAPEPLAVEETPAPEPVADEPLAEQRPFRDPDASYACKRRSALAVPKAESRHPSPHIAFRNSGR